MSVSVITKPVNQMSGYNLFVKNYVQRKDQGLDPYKLPDGTLFSGNFIMQEEGYYLFQEDNDKLITE